MKQNVKRGLLHRLSSSDFMKWCKGFVRKHRRLLIFIALYAGLVFSFAVLDWLIYRYNTTSFLISEQLNKYVDRYEFLDPEIDLAAYHRNAKDKLPITIDGFTVLVKPSFDELQATNDSLLLNKDLLSACLERWDSLGKVASAMKSDSIEQVRTKLLFGYQEKIDSLKRFMEGKDSTTMIIEGKYVEMAQLQYEYAKKNAKVQTMIGQYIGNFIPDSLSHKIRKCNEDYLGLTMTISELEMTRRDVTSQIRNLTKEFHANRRDAVSFMDFVYYSICVSTTVSFGDIAPNNGLTRTVAIIELLLCIILVGAIVDRIIKRKEE